MATTSTTGDAKNLRANTHRGNPVVKEGGGDGDALDVRGLRINPEVLRGGFLCRASMTSRW